MQYFLTNLLLVTSRLTEEEKKREQNSVRDLPAWIRYTRSRYLRRIGVSVSDSNIMENDGSLEAVTAYANFMMDNMNRKDYFWLTDNQEVRKLKKEAQMAAISAKHAFQQNPPSPPEPLGVKIRRQQDVPEPIDVGRGRRSDHASESSNDSDSESEASAHHQNLRKKMRRTKETAKAKKSAQKRPRIACSEEDSSDDSEGSCRDDVEDDYSSSDQEEDHEEQSTSDGDDC